MIKSNAEIVQEIRVLLQQLQEQMKNSKEEAFTFVAVARHADPNQDQLFFSAGGGDEETQMRSFMLAMAQDQRAANMLRMASYYYELSKGNNPHGTIGSFPISTS